jgi:hypothetical protein
VSAGSQCPPVLYRVRERMWKMAVRLLEGVRFQTRRRQTAKRALAALFSAALLSGTMISPAAAGQVACNQKTMRTIEALRYGVFGTPYERCTFRLFLPGGTQETAWTAAEYLHGGTYFEVLPADVEAHGWGEADVINYYGQIEQHLFWGKNSTPDAQLVELRLTRGPIFQLKEAVPELNWPAGTYLQETYFNFGPQTPGLYKWRYTFNDPILYGSLSRVGHVAIDPA